MADYKYCTLNVISSNIKDLTCPAPNCSDKARQISVDNLDKNVTEEISWEAGEFSNCKIQFQANPDILKPLHIDVNFTNLVYDAYQFPRFYNKSRGYHGLIELPGEFYLNQGI